MTERRSEVWTEKDGGEVCAADQFGDIVRVAIQAGDGALSFKTVPLNLTDNPWVTLSPDTTQDFLKLLAERIAALSSKV